MTAAPVDVRDFGAVGDGITDDSGAFARAFEAAERTGAAIVPAGTYRIARTIRPSKRRKP